MALLPSLGPRALHGPTRLVLQISPRKAPQRHPALRQRNQTDSHGDEHRAEGEGLFSGGQVHLRRLELHSVVSLYPDLFSGRQDRYRGRIPKLPRVDGEVSGSTGGEEDVGGSVFEQ